MTYLLQFGKPHLDLIQPRRISGREVQPHVRMRGKKGIDVLRLVRPEVVTDDVNLLLGQAAFYNIFEKCDCSRSVARRPRQSRTGLLPTSTLSSRWRQGTDGRSKKSMLANRRRSALPDSQGSERAGSSDRRAKAGGGAETECGLRSGRLRSNQANA